MLHRASTYYFVFSFHVIIVSYHMILLFLSLCRDVIDTTGKLTYLGSVFVYSDGLQVKLQ